MAENGGAPLLLSPLAAAPTTTDEGSIYYDTDGSLYVYSNTGWVDVTDTGGSGNITAVGSMTTGAAFAGTDADDQWLGLGAGQAE